MENIEPQSAKTLIVGLGKTGLSCARYLAKQGVAFAVTDSRENPPGLEEIRQEMPDLAIFVGGFNAEVFAAASQLVVSPGVSLQEPQICAARERGVEVLGDVELFARAVCNEAPVPQAAGSPERLGKAQVVAITGSNGKSTVTMLVGEMAQASGLNVAVGGNLGRPALDLLAQDVQLYVLELSSFQLESTRSLKAAAAAVLNVSPDHMDRYAGLDDYAATKAVVYRGADTGVINRDDPRVAAMSGISLTELGFTLGGPQGDDFGIGEHAGMDWLYRGETPLLPVTDLRIPGRHNLANALAALALGSAVGLPLVTMQAALRDFKGLPHRTQFVAEKQQLHWYNDSKGTNVGATVAALDGLHPEEGDSRTVLIAGGDCKGADFSELAPVVARTVRAVVLIGKDAPMIEQALQGKTRMVHAATLSEAVGLAQNLGQPGDRVLLSPACASFDMFRNFEVRGDAFIQAVEALAA